MKKAFRMLGRLLPLLVISLVVGISGYSWNARAVGQNAMPMPFGVGMSVVLSGSMEPTLHVNDLVFIRAAESYEQGDIIVYQSGNSLIIHRLLETDGTTAITQGDANNAPDEPFPTYCIKGRLVGRIAGIGAVMRAVKSTPGTLAILAAAIFFLLRSRQNERDAAEAETEKIRQEIEKLKAELLSEEAAPEGHSDQTENKQDAQS